MIRPPVALVIILVGLSQYFQTGSCENPALEDRIEILSAELGIPEWKVRKFLNIMTQWSERSKYENGILQVRKKLLRVFMIEGEHYTTTAEIFTVLTSPLCLDELSEAKRVQDRRGESTEKIEAVVV